MSIREKLSTQTRTSSTRKITIFFSRFDFCFIHCQSYTNMIDGGQIIFMKSFVMQLRTVTIFKKVLGFMKVK